MKTLKNMILALVAMAFMTSPSYSDGADGHSGLYAGVMTSFNGLELDGKYQQATDNTTGVAGKSPSSSSLLVCTSSASVSLGLSTLASEPSSTTSFLSFATPAPLLVDC